MTNAGQSSTNVGTGDVSGVPDVSQVPGVSDANASDGPNDPSSCLPSILRPQTSTTVAEGDPIGPSGVTADRSSQPGSKSTQGSSKPTSSVFSRSESAPVHNVPMRVIHRPLPSELDESKVQAFMREMQAGDSFTPIELAKVKAPLPNDPTGQVHVFYFAMGGCHRYEATKRLGWETIRARIIDVPAGQMRVYLGAGSPF